MKSDLVTAKRYVHKFIEHQKKFGVKETPNIIQCGWNMRDVIEHVNNEVHMKQLLQFYFKYSDSKTFRDFFYTYHEYYDKMIEVKEDRKRRKAIFNETMKRSQEN